MSDNDEALREALLQLEVLRERESRALGESNAVIDIIRRWILADRVVQGRFDPCRLQRVDPALRVTRSNHARIADNERPPSAKFAGQFAELIIGDDFNPCIQIVVLDLFDGVFDTEKGLADAFG